MERTASEDGSVLCHRGREWPVKPSVGDNRRHL